VCAATGSKGAWSGCGEIVSKLVQAADLLICAATPTHTRELPRGKPVTLQAGNLCPRSIAMSATAETLSPVLLYEALLEVGMSVDTLSDLRSTVADGDAFIVGDGGGVDAGCHTYPAAGDVDIHSASLLMSAALARIAERRGSGGPAQEVDGADAFAALGFTPLASAALQAVRIQAQRQRAQPSAMAVATTHIERHIAAFDVSSANPSSWVQHTLRAPVTRQRGRLDDTSPAALRELRLYALARIELLAAMGFSLSVDVVVKWRMALRDPANHLMLFEVHTDAWHDAADILNSKRVAVWPGWSELGFTPWACEALTDWVSRSSGRMSCIEAAFHHVSCNRRGALGIADAPLTYAAQAKDASVPLEWAARYTISTRVLSAVLCATADSFGAAFESFAQSLNQDGCTLFFHGTTSDAISHKYIYIAAGRCAQGFNHMPTNGFYHTKLPVQAADWAMSTTGLMRSHPGSPNHSVWPAVVVYRIDNVMIHALRRLEYSCSEPFDAVGVVPDGAPLTAPVLIQACLLGVGTPATEQLVHWIEGPQLLNARDEPSSWRFGGHQVCVKRAVGLEQSHRYNAEDLLRDAVVGVCLAAVE
jgi:hypothetical protein